MVVGAGDFGRGCAIGIAHIRVSATCEQGLGSGGRAAFRGVVQSGVAGQVLAVDRRAASHQQFDDFGMVVERRPIEREAAVPARPSIERVDPRPGIQGRFRGGQIAAFRCIP